MPTTDKGNEGAVEKLGALQHHELGRHPGRRDARDEIFTEARRRGAYAAARQLSAGGGELIERPQEARRPEALGITGEK